MEHQSPRLNVQRSQVSNIVPHQFDDAEEDLGSVQREQFGSDIRSNLSQHEEEFPIQRVFQFPSRSNNLGQLGSPQLRRVQSENVLHIRGRDPELQGRDDDLDRSVSRDEELSVLVEDGDQQLHGHGLGIHQDDPHVVDQLHHDHDGVQVDHQASQKLTRPQAKRIKETEGPAFKDGRNAIHYNAWAGLTVGKLAGPAWQSAINEATQGTKLFGAIAPLATSPMTLLDMWNAIAGIYDAAKASNKTASLLEQNAEKHGAFLANARQLKLLQGRVQDNETIVQGLQQQHVQGPQLDLAREQLENLKAELERTKEALILNAPGFLAYEGAASKELGDGRAMTKAATVFARDFVAQGGSFGANVTTSVTALSSGLTATNVVASVLGGAFGIVAGGLHLVVSEQEKQIANKTIEGARKAKENIDRATGEDGHVDLRMINELDKSMAKREKLKEYLEHGSPADKKHLAEVYDGIKDRFKENQDKAIDKARGDKRFATLRKWFGVSSVGLGVAGVVAAALGIGTMGIGLAIAGAVAGAIFLGVVGVRAYRGWKEKKALKAQDNALQAQAKDAVTDKTVKEMEEAYKTDQHRGNKYFAAQVLAQHVLDRREERDENGKPIRTDEIYARRKLATRFLVGLGMSRESIQAHKQGIRLLPPEKADERAKRETEFVQDIANHLMGDAARRDHSQHRSGWTRFFDFFRGVPRQEQPKVAPPRDLELDMTEEAHA